MTKFNQEELNFLYYSQEGHLKKLKNFYNTHPDFELSQDLLREAMHYCINNNRLQTLRYIYSLHEDNLDPSYKEGLLLKTALGCIGESGTWFLNKLGYLSGKNIKLFNNIFIEILKERKGASFQIALNKCISNGFLIYLDPLFIKISSQEQDINQRRKKLLEAVNLKENLSKF